MTQYSANAAVVGESNADTASHDYNADMSAPQNWRRLYDSEDILQRQGQGLCELIASTNIETLREANDLVGWRCEYHSDLGMSLPMEDSQVTVCGNYMYNCNTTSVGAEGCSRKNITTASWTGVNCSESINRFTMKNLVTTIDLNNRQLTGTIPPEIGLMSGLKELDLSENALTGSLHTTWMCDSLFELTMLQLDDNALTSSIPNCIGNLTHLTDLRLHDNILTSTVPSSIHNLTLLTEIDLSNNKLTGSFPLAIFYMPKMKTIDANTNLLTVLPDMGDGVTEGGWFGDMNFLNYIDFSDNLIASDILAKGTWSLFMPQLITLYLFNNAMTGNINASLSHFYKLEDLRAQNNLLTGFIPDSVGDMTRLTHLKLDDNQLTSNIPHYIGLATGLQTLTLSNNQLTNTIPHNITYLTNMVELDLSENLFNGTLNNDIFSDLEELEILYLQDNSLTGAWPEFIDQVSLQYFDLSRNTWTQELPHDLLGLNCSELQSFICTECGLTGTIPDLVGSFGALTKLQRLELSFNSITGSIPDSFTELSLLNYLYLDRNNLTSTIPDGLWDLEHLSHVYLGYNTLTGTIPESPSSPSYTVTWIVPWGSITTSRLVNLDLTENMLTGTIPDNTFTSNTNLATLKLGSNQLTGTVGTNLWSVTKLTTIWLSDNSLTGAFPTGFESLTALNSVMFDDNGFTGEIPDIFRTPSSLTELDLSGNELTGTVQTIMCIANTTNCPDLTYLKLARMTSSGGSVGSIPTRIQYYPNLLSLDLSGNSYTGTVPDALKSLTVLSSLELQENSLTGALETDLFDGMSLETLDVSDNGFTGTFPWTGLISNNANSLKYLSIDENAFTGGVPASLGSSVTGLVSIYMGDNRFSGSIPTTMSALANLDVLDMGNNIFTGNMDDSDYADLGDFPKLRVLDLGRQNFGNSDFSAVTWLNTLNQNGYLKELDIQDTGLTGKITSIFLGYATQLKYLDVSDNAITGTIAGDSRMTDLVYLEDFRFNGNDLDNRLDEDLCLIPNITSITAFPGNLDLECYPSCLLSFMSVTTNAYGITTCEPTAIPTASPTLVPTSAPSVQPTGQPTSQPSFMYYDGKFVQTGEYLWPNVSSVRNDTLCMGELELRSYYSGDSFEDSLTSNHTEVWCVQQRNYLEWRYFGIDDLNKDLNIKNALGSPYPASGTVLSKSTLHTVVYRGKQNETSVNFLTQPWDGESVASSSAYSSGGCGTECATTSLDFGTGDNETVYLWEDALLACPLMGTTGHSAKKILPVSRSDSWPYGSSAMIQKVRLTDTPVAPLDSSSTTSSSVDAEVAALFRTGTTQLVGAYLMVKGTVIGGRDRLSIQNARRGWRENTTSCSDSSGGELEWAYDYSADLIEGGFTASTVENVTISHDTHSWATADVTDMTRNQLVWWYLNHPGEAFELNLLWNPLNYTMDRTYGFDHYYYNAAGDIQGDTDRASNMTTGRTEWYTSESGDPPILLLYFQ